MVVTIKINIKIIIKIKLILIIIKINNKRISYLKQHFKQWISIHRSAFNTDLNKRNSEK